MDDFEWKLYSKYFSGYDPDFPNANDCECGSQSKLV
jgi:hypothetical protein